jgi:hypothetical protein
MSEIKVGQLRRWHTWSKLERVDEMFLILGIRPSHIEDLPLFYTPDPEEGKIYNEVLLYFVGAGPNNNLLKFSEEFVSENSEVVQEDGKSSAGTITKMD